MQGGRDEVRGREGRADWIWNSGLSEVSDRQRDKEKKIPEFWHSWKNRKWFYYVLKGGLLVFSYYDL